MSYFTPEFLKFFRGLKRNNSKTWFEANRERYETAVKEPFAAFIEEMLARLRAEDPTLSTSAKQAIFRLNRDIRFSKDKTPYKTHMAANISPSGRKNLERPGFYIQFGPEEVLLGGGAYMLENATIYRIRQAIVKNLAAFEAILKEKSFKQKFGTLQGEQNKVLSGEFKTYAAKQPLLANKQFYYMAELKAETILKKNLPEVVMQYYHAGKAMNDFLEKAMRG